MENTTGDKARGNQSEMKLPELPETREGFMFDAIQMLAYGRACADAALEAAAAEAEHWQKISTTPGHACGQYVAAAIRALKENP